MSAVGTTIRLHYGSIEILRYVRTENASGWSRHERYTPDAPADTDMARAAAARLADRRPVLERSFCLNDGDVSTRHSMYPTGYDGARCSCCWLGFTHTEDLHADAVARANAKTASR